MDYLEKLLQWVLAVLFNAKTATLAGNLLILYGKFMLGDLTVEQLWIAVQAAILAWIGVSVVHGGAKRVGLLQ